MIYHACLRLFAVLSFAIIFISPLAAQPARKPKRDLSTTPALPDALLKKLLDDHWQYVLSNTPEFATYLGDHRYDDKLNDYSAAAVKRDYDSLRVFGQRIKAIDFSKLSPAARTDAMLFQRDLETSLAAEPLRLFQMPLGQQTGLHLDFPMLPFSHPFETVKDYENYVKRLQQFPAAVNETIKKMREGMAAGRMPPKFIVEKIIPQLQAGVLTDATQSPLYEAVQKLPKSFSAADSLRLAAAIEKEIRSAVTPAYETLLTFVKTEYLPKARTEAGIWATPNGAAWYQYEIKYHTTTNLTADEIHEIGLRELARIHSEMKEILKKVGFTGTLEAFNDTLRRDSRFYYTNADSLEQGFRKILAEIEPKLLQLFPRLPKTKFELKRIESYREVSSPAAYYYQPNEDGSRPGYFYYNAYRLDSRPKYTMEALAYHEAVPGHHLQIALAMENKNLSAFRRNSSYTAYIEGWGLYSERLPKELGAYSDPYSDYGRLTFDAWRCSRLVVDTGIHHKHWTRERAIDFMKANTAVSEVDAVSEVERYISTPGQALAYKIGQLKLLELRAKAELQLGKKFDIKAFHGVVLGEGAMPLDVLEKKVGEWINRQKQ